MHAVLVAANLEMVEQEVVELAEMQTELALPHVQALEMGYRQVPHEVHRQMAPQAEHGFFFGRALVHAVHADRQAVNGDVVIPCPGQRRD